jgi:hypothetical protein
MEQIGFVPTASPRAEHIAWGMMWTTGCRWVLQRDRPLSEKSLRIALLELIKRHPALHSEPVDGTIMFSRTQEALSVFEMLRKRTHAYNCQGHYFEQAACWAFKSCWPRVHQLQAPPSLETLPLQVKQRTGSFDEAKQQLWSIPRFVPPFQVALAQYGPQDGEDVAETNPSEGALVHIAVTHMFSDGYSIIPILGELAHLVAAAESTSAVPLPPLPPLPDAFSSLERRLLRTIDGDHSMHDAMTYEAIGRTKCAFSREVTTIIATLEPDLVSRIKMAGQSLAVADDIAMLSLLGATLARWRSQGNTTLSMIVPQRDGPSESDLIGLFADIRFIDIYTSGLSYAGVALWIQHIVKERLWRSPPVGTQFANPLINFEWTDFDSRQGFSQVPQPRQGEEHGVCNPLKLAVDQPDRFTWRLRAAFDTKLYEHEDRERFFTIFKECLRAMLHDPLAPIWPAEPKPNASESASPEGGTGGSVQVSLSEPQ